MHDRPFSLAGDLEITAVAPTSAAAMQAMRVYICDVASSYYRRPATTAEVQAALVQHPSDDLVPPTGLFLVATDGHDIVGGCVALARVDHEVGEVRRLHVAPALRGLGLGRRLMLEVEHRAREMGGQLQPARPVHRRVEPTPTGRHQHRASHRRHPHRHALDNERGRARTASGPPVGPPSPNAAQAASSTTSPTDSGLPSPSWTPPAPSPPPTPTTPPARPLRHQLARLTR